MPKWYTFFTNRLSIILLPTVLHHMVESHLSFTAAPLGWEWCLERAQVTVSLWMPPGTHHPSSCLAPRGCGLPCAVARPVFALLAPVFRTRIGFSSIVSSFYCFLSQKMWGYCFFVGIVSFWMLVGCEMPQPRSLNLKLQVCSLVMYLEISILQATIYHPVKVVLLLENSIYWWFIYFLYFQSVGILYVLVFAYMFFLLYSWYLTFGHILRCVLL